MGTFKLLCRDVIEALRPLPPDLFHGCLCDPPYGLKFMGKKWDHGVPEKEYWTEVLRVLKPGAPILACGGSRTYHRLACAIEDAGFEIFDSILGSVWIQGQGFPKSLDIGKAIDKAAGVERLVIGRRTYGDGHIQNSTTQTIGFHGCDPDADKRLITVPSTEAAQAWNGYGTALKPAWEPIVFAHKPLSGTYAENCIEHGCGGLNIDESRIGTDPSGWGGKAAGGGTWNASNCGLAKDGTPTNSVGRYPANLLLSHHPECDDADGCYPECPMAALDRQSGTLTSGRLSPDNNVKACSGWSGGSRADRVKNTFLPNSGGASRFFYCAKVSTAERNAGGVTNSHATLKPLALTTYLAKLILPPLHVSSRLLVPFCGTGSEMAGALIAGWGHVVGIDNDPESISTAQLRIPGLIARGTK